MKKTLQEKAEQYANDKIDCTYDIEYMSEEDMEDVQEHKIFSPFIFRTRINHILFKSIK